MPIEVIGVNEVVNRLRRIEDRTTQRQLRRLKKGAKDITQTAKNYAPVDQGNLEEAITAVATREGTFKNRIEFLIGVDKSKLGPGKNPGGFDYDVEMHEGHYKLGERSKEKQERLGVIVGAKYLERALQDHEPGIIEDMERIVEEETR